MKGPLRNALVLLVVDVLLLVLFSYVTGTRGLVSPSGSLHADVALAGAVFLVFRVAARFLVPALVVLGVSRELLTRRA
jgi:hypothetical protein